MTYHPGTFVWFELETRDLDDAQAFYREVFGWATEGEAAGEVAYEMIAVAGQTIGGYRKLRTRGEPYWASFLSVPHLIDAIASVKGAGGRHIDDVVETPGLGKSVEIVDAVGAKVHLVRRRGGDDPLRPRPPGTVLWNELVTRLPDRAVDFYKAAFGYTSKRVEIATGGAYHILQVGAVGKAGIVCRDTSPRWMPYVHVTDCDQALARAIAAGGKVVESPTDVPQIGRYAVFADSQGAELAMMTPSTVTA